MCSNTNSTLVKKYFVYCLVLQLNVRTEVDRVLTRESPKGSETPHFGLCNPLRLFKPQWMKRLMLLSVRRMTPALSSLLLSTCS